MNQKQCNKCNEIKDLSGFGLDKRNKDGLQGICEVCRKAKKQADRTSRKGIVAFLKEKTCNKCGMIKMNKEFYRDAGLSDGYATICKVCKDKNTVAWKVDNKDQYNAGLRKWRAENKDAAKNIDLMRTYGIDLAQYNAMLSSQNGVCAICAKPPKGKRPLVVDHCHDTGKIRQLLCYGCNRLIVSLDNHPLHSKIVDYLKK